MPTQTLRASVDSAPAAPAPAPAPAQASHPQEETRPHDTGRGKRPALYAGIGAVVVAILLVAYARLHDGIPSGDSASAQPQAAQDQQAPADGAVPTAPAPTPGVAAADGAGAAQPEASAPVQAAPALPAATDPSAVPASAGPGAPGAPAAILSRPMPAPGGSAAGTAGAVTAATGSANPNAGATYRLQIQPWGTVYVDGIDRGVSPPIKRLQLPPGRHTIRVTNPNFQEHVLDVDTTSGDGRIVVDFGAAE